MYEYTAKRASLEAEPAISANGGVGRLAPRFSFASADRAVGMSRNQLLAAGSSGTRQLVSVAIRESLIKREHQLRETERDAGGDDHPDQQDSAMMRWLLREPHTS